LINFFTTGYHGNYISCWIQ